MLPTFLVIGAMKAGTTSIAQYIGAHPQVFLTAEKEPHFFSFRDRYELGMEWYESLFAAAGDAVARGEASTTYAKYPGFPGTPDRVAAALPDARLLYVVRHPIERIQSQYLHEAVRGQQTRPLAELLPERHQYVDISRYAVQLDQYLAHYPRSQVMVVTSEGLRGKRSETMRSVYEFLGVDPDATPDELGQEFHETAGRLAVRPFERRLQVIPGRKLASRLAPSTARSVYRRLSSRPAADLRPLAHIPDDLRQRLEHELADDVARLRPFLGDDFDGWGIA